VVQRDSYCSRILPLHDTDARLAEGIAECEEEEGAGGPRVASRGHQLLQLLLLFSLQSLLIHDVGGQRGAAAVGHHGFRREILPSGLGTGGGIPKAPLV